VKLNLSSSDIINTLKAINNSRKSYQSIFVHIPLLPISGKISNLAWVDERFWKGIIDALNQNGVLWCCTNTSPTLEGLDVFPLELAVRLQALGLCTRNVVLWYNSEYPNCSVMFKNRATYVLFVTKDAREYKFSVDAVREPHIWRDYEWGGGRRSRYHPLGKNPSNFWLRTKSKAGKILMHVPLTWSEMAKRCLQTCTQEGDEVLGIVPRNRDFVAVCKELNLEYQIVALPVENREYETGARTCHNIQNQHQFIEASNGPTIHLPRIYFKSSESMVELKEGEAQVIVTSPPYWGLRDYGVKDQIGFDESYSRYLSRLEAVWLECHRILNNSGTLWININKRMINGKILLFPVDVIKSCNRVGFKLQDIVIWFRAISVPGSGEKNFTDRYEFILVFSKKDEFKFYPQRIDDKDFLNEEKGDLINVWKLYRMIGNLNEEFGAKTKLAIKHTAMFPEELVRRVVLLCSDEGETVLDPFLGSGTTVAVATKLGRNSVGYEINEAFKPLVQKKLRDATESLSRFL